MLKGINDPNMQPGKLDIATSRIFNAIAYRPSEITYIDPIQFEMKNILY